MTGPKYLWSFCRLTKTWVLLSKTPYHYTILALTKYDVATPLGWIKMSKLKAQYILRCKRSRLNSFR